MMRYRITFAKTEAMRFTGHLDLFRTWERTFRRAELPLAYSQGFNPRPRFNLAAALPLGFTSRCEVADVWLEKELGADELLAQLAPALPPGLAIEAIWPVDLRAPALQTQVLASEFSITFLEPVPDLAERCKALLSAPELKRERRNKSYDLRALIEELRPLEEDENGRGRLFTRLSASEGATGRPEELVDALGSQPQATLVERSRIIFSSEYQTSG